LHIIFGLRMVVTEPTSPPNKENYMNGVRQMLEDAGCILEGEYFVALKERGLVTKKYIDLDPVLTDPMLVERLATALIEDLDQDYSCFVAPTMGAVPLLYAAAFRVMRGRIGRGKLTTAFAEKDGEHFTLGRMGFTEAIHGRKVVVFEDISSTGNTPRAVCELVRRAGGTVVAVSLIWNRGGLTAKTIGVPHLQCLVNETVETWRAENSPPGWGTLPLVSDIGHPGYFPDYPGPRISLLGS